MSNLQFVLPWMFEKQPTLSLDDKICDSCRKQLAKISSAEAKSTKSFESNQDVSICGHFEESVHRQESLGSLNQ